MKRTRSVAFAALTTFAALAALVAFAALAPAQAQAAKAAPAGTLSEGARKAKAAKPVPPKITGAKVLEFGVYTSTVVSREKSPSVADGIKDRATDFKLVRKSTLVDARLGTSIGLKYVLRGTPKGATVSIEVAVTHPPMVNPDTGQSMTYSTATFERVLDQPEHALWSFDTPGDLVPGEYLIELVSEGKVLAKKVFRVRIRQ
jgi:hypothetical protein